MGGTTSTRRVTFEADENENITVVKGMRLSENVIDRMKESSPPRSKSQRYSGAYGASCYVRTPTGPQCSSLTSSISLCHQLPNNIALRREIKTVRTSKNHQR
uniref:Uncharacterized protein n=1 Tax=Rhinopithecus bieti TaxID=61621 RepID=A0A2K6LR12_RHIBE